MSADVWTIISVGVAILGCGRFAYVELRKDIRGLRGEVSNLRERLAKLEGRLEGPSFSQMLQSGGDQNAGP